MDHGNKFKVYCTFNYKWHFTSLENIDFSMNTSVTQSREEFLIALKGCHGILCNPRSHKIDKEALDAAGIQLKVIITPSAGYDTIDINECCKRNVLVGNLPNSYTDSVAEFTIGLILNMSRRITEATSLAKNLDWNQILIDRLLTGKCLRGSTVGFFGLGSIGLEIAYKLSVFGVKKIIYNNRKVNQESVKLNCEFVDFETLLKDSDFMICCASSNKENENKFDLNAFKKMKKDCIFINIARGALVNHDDLVKALNSKLIFSAAIDVSVPEPLPKDHILYSLPNCIVTPHIAWDDEKSRVEPFDLCLKELINGLNDKPLLYKVKI